MTQLAAVPRFWLGILITVEIAAAYGYLTALAMAKSAIQATSRAA